MGRLRRALWSEAECYQEFEFLNLIFQWKEIDQKDLMVSKLTCVFAMPKTQGTKNENKS